MPISRSSFQRKQSLKDFYLEFTAHQNEVFANGAKQMIEFIKIIDETFEITQIWAHTSHARLAIQPNNDELLTNYIYISNIGVNEFYFEFKLPKERSPWIDAWVKGTANSLEEAKRYLIISMKESGQWKNNEELNSLISKLS